MNSSTGEITEEEAGASASASSVSDITIPVQASSSILTDWKIHRVPQQMRRKDQTSYLYDPIMVSYGPYHHGKRHLLQAEEFKPQVLNLLFSETGRDKDFFMKMILKWIDHIRNCYVGISRDVYDDVKLAELMLADASLILYLLDVQGRKSDIESFILMSHKALGLTCMQLMMRDLYVLENQVPFWIVQYLDNFSPRRGQRPMISPIVQPLHLLAIDRAVLVGWQQATHDVMQVRSKSKLRWRSREKGNIINDNLEKLSRPFRSVMDLKAKGIRFRPSSKVLKDIRFESYYFHGQLQLPSCHITEDFKYKCSNMIAFELSPGVFFDFGVTSYVNFMKSLIQSTDDVKELREKGIFTTTLSNKEVVQMFEEMDTYGLEQKDDFLEVKMRIEKHCSNKAKTWMAELLHTYFRSPWTALALFAAVLALCLSSLQSYYSIRRANKSSS
ncbi:UNVERIFIED_CONTAM: hypothetical protein Sradi_2679700 [Sesamum radiatum]|uniref:Uncharacterized protein n=1 Tax=Sesamum radiatum TaxID=300843 RepID=A0AAW2S778_SESRA